ncbi:outer membrane beta-barrel family protein [Rufibacter latericius]|uniref:TonB-dependent receptor n=1 Tax=Rufibacter latericius TaxID=2487040 RepID=A0A3M9MK39_9BACT|nr:outer membrane beta-barrel family protein [Rufibacter latericius]RNI25911.1 TonB-dependent receptor [Rufibacter latericius]
MNQTPTFRQFPFLVFLSLIFSFSALAQSGTSVKGTVLDGKKQPLAYATIMLLGLPDSTLVNSQMTDEAGVYVFEKVASGRYVIKASRIDHHQVLSPVFEVGTQPVQVPFLQTTLKTTVLNEVVVQGQRPLLEQQADRLIMNVEKLNTAGENSLEVLKNAPGVRLDKDDNIIFRGSGSVNVMINGKMTYMSGSELSMYLKSLPASAVSKVELIANPPASFDAAGTAGIINIVLKRELTKGMNGTLIVGTGYGTYEKAGVSTNLNYNLGKVSFYTRLHISHSNSYNKLTMERTIRDSLYRSVNYWHPITKTVNVVAGADYFINKQHTVGIMLKGYSSPQDVLTTSNSVNYDIPGRAIGSVQMSNPRDVVSNNYSLNLNYKFDIDTTGRSLTFDADFVRYQNGADESFTNQYFAAAIRNGREFENLRSFSDAAVQIYALKADYVHPLPHNWKAETGWKSSWVRNDSDIKFETLQENTWLTDDRRTNQFLYDENINAGYISLSKKVSKALSLKAGLRAEQTISRGNSRTTQNVVDRNYWELFPSVFASYNPSEDHQFSTSYSRRISRPNYRSLNPFTFFSDPYMGIKGNPFLQPSFSNSLVASYTFKNFQLLSISYLQQNDFVMEVVSQNDATKESISTPQNLSRARTLGISSGGTLPMRKWWSANLQLQGNLNKVSTPVQGEQYNQEQFSWDFSTDNNFTLPKNFSVQYSAYYSSPSVSGLFRNKASYLMSIGAKKTFMDGRATVSVKLNDIFDTSRFRANLNYSNVNMYWENEWESRRLNLTFDFKFGNSKIKAARSRKTGTSDEENRVSR